MKDGGAVAVSRAQGARRTWRQACGCSAPGRVRMSAWLEWRQGGGEWARARPRRFGDSFPGRVTCFGRGRIRFAFYKMVLAASWAQIWRGLDGKRGSEQASWKPQPRPMQGESSLGRARSSQRPGRGYTWARR